MSIFKTIISDLKTFASKVEKFFAEIANEEPQIAKIVAATLTYVGPLLQTIVTLTAGAPAGALVRAIISKAQTDLAAVSALVEQIGPTPSVQNIIAGVIADLSQLPSTANITDAKTLDIIQLVLGELQALATAFAASPAATPSPAPAASPAPAEALAAAQTIQVPAPVADPAPAALVGGTAQSGPGLSATVVA